MLLWLEPIKVNYHAARFGCHRHSCSRDIQVFVCHVNLQDDLINALYEFMLRRLSRYITILPSLVVIVEHNSGFKLSIMVSFCHVISQDHVIKVIILSTLVALGTLILDIQWLMFVSWLCRTARSERYVTLWLGAHQCKSPSYQVW